VPIFFVWFFPQSIYSFGPPRFPLADPTFITPRSSPPCSPSFPPQHCDGSEGQFLGSSSHLITPIKRVNILCFNARRCHSLPLRTPFSRWSPAHILFCLLSDRSPYAATSPAPKKATPPSSSIPLSTPALFFLAPPEFWYRESGFFFFRGPLLFPVSVPSPQVRCVTFSLPIGRGVSPPFWRILTAFEENLALFSSSADRFFHPNLIFFETCPFSSPRVNQRPATSLLVDKKARTFFFLVGGFKPRNGRVFFPSWERHPSSPKPL